MFFTRGIIAEIAVLVLVYMLGIVCSFHGSSVPTVTVFIIAVIAWARTMHKRVIQEKTRRTLSVMAFFLIIQFLLKLVNYAYSGGMETFARYCRYCYYISFILAPFLSIKAAEELLAQELRKTRLLQSSFIISIVLIILVMTNDLHGLVFRFSDGIPDMSDFSCGFMYYVICAWIALMLILTILAVFGNCSLRESRRHIWIPFTYILTFPVIILGVTLTLFSTDEIEFMFQESFWILLIGLWELLMGIGLVRSNTCYDMIFDHSSLAAMITDEDCNVIQASSKAPQIRREQLWTARHGVVYPDDNTRLQSRHINGGYVFWIDDITEFNEVNARLSDINSQLREEGNIIRQENELKKQKTVFETQNKLYDDIAGHLSGRLKKVNALLESGTDSEIAQACVLTAYIKRYANLKLIADRSEYVDLKELCLSLAESMVYMRMSLITCELTEHLTGSFNSNAILALYEYIEFITEEKLLFGSLAAPFIAVSLALVNGRLLARITLPGEVRLGPDEGTEELIRNEATVLVRREGEWLSVFVSCREGGAWVDALL